MKKIIMSLCYVSFITCLLFVTSCNNDEITSLSGVVSDEGGNPLEGVTINVREIDSSFTTDNKGKYKITDLTPGTYNLYVDKRGYEAASLIVKIELGVERIVNITLIESSIKEYEIIAINFNELLTDPETEYIGNIDPEAEEWDYTESTFQGPTQILTFNHYTTAGGSYFGGGFTYTNKTDIITNNYTNPSAITAKGYTGDTYLTCTSNSYTPAVIKLNQSRELKGFYITNASYAYLTMKNGSDFSTPFGNSDYFKLTIIGKLNGEKISSIEYYLAKDGNIVNTWEWVDLTSLGEIDELNFDFDSSDKSEWGGEVYLNTPTYFCLDEITLVVHSITNEYK